jgi:hypothetical protein
MALDDVSPGPDQWPYNNEDGGRIGSRESLRLQVHGSWKCCGNRTDFLLESESGSLESNALQI